MTTRRSFLGALAAAGAGAALARGKEEDAAPRETQVIAENPVIGACGPYALANALVSGDAACRRAFGALPGATQEQRTQALIGRFGGRQSETYGNRPRFLKDAGIATDDLTFMTRDFLAASSLPQARADWLDAQPGETSHARRVHGLFCASLARGFPPLLEIRAFAADSTARQPSWLNLYAHWLTLVGVDPSILPARASGFLCRFADSFTGRVILGFAGEELYRPFMATRGFAVKSDGAKDWHWLSGRPYLLLDLPDVPLTMQTRPWHERTIVACTYLIHRSA